MRLRAGLGGLALLTLAMFFETLVAPGPQVLGAAHTDLASQFLAWRQFGFGELAKGNLALWNPHVFSGAPFFGGMQSALLYPPNWLFLFLPLPLALNWSVALNAWLLGTFMYLWGLRRALHPFAAFVSAALLMFSAPYFLRVEAGNITNLAAMPWIPLLFLAIDAWLASRRLSWCLIGMFAVATQLLAGHPQYVYLTAIGAGGYALLRLAEPHPSRWRAAAGLVGFYGGGASLAAAQLFAGFQATGETIRALPLPFQFAATFSFPPENLITLIAPVFFGDGWLHPYWGRWYLWEACAFIGVTGLALAAYGLATARIMARGALVAIAVGAAIVALGDNTPLFRVLFDWVPLFDRFRGTAKFIFLTTLVLVLFAGYGLDCILRERKVRLSAIGVAGATALALFAVAAALRMADWEPVVKAVLIQGENFNADRLADRGFVLAGREFASLGLLLAGVTLAAAACIGLWTHRNRHAVFIVGVFAVAEIFAFARMHRPTFDATQTVIAPLRDFLAANPGDYRILNLANPNSAMSMRAFDAWGYDPGVTRRYAEFMEWSVGGNPDRATQYVAFRNFHRLLSMLRVKYVVVVENGVMTIVPGGTPPLRRLELIASYQVHGRRAEILRAMDEPSFDPRREVILEREPDPAPVAGNGQGRARIVREGTDFIEIEADLPNSSVLLVTDAWAAGWRAVPLEATSQSRYELMPANYTLRAVALSPGAHRLRLEYAPLAFRLGVAVSVLAWAAWVLFAFLLWGRRKGVARA